MMKNKTIKFKIIGVLAYFIIMLSANPQNLVLAWADEEARKMIEATNNDVANLIPKIGQLESEISKTKSEQKRNWESLRDEINDIKNGLKQKVSIEDDKEWKSEFENRLNGIDDKLKESVKTLRTEVVNLQNSLNIHSNDINAIWPKVSNIEKDLGNIRTMVENLENLGAVKNSGDRIYYFKFYTKYASYL